MDEWSSPQRILVILAHPDDPEFFCGASIARWSDAGHEVIYWLLTCGDKGADDRCVDPRDLCRIRHDEQQAAAAVLGVRQVNFLDYPDGHLVADLDLRRAITRIIRQVRPDILVTCDPNTLFVGNQRINHPDHRAAGQAALDAVFPAAGNPLYFPELLHEERLEPHTVREVWVSGTLTPNLVMDVTDLWERKLRALHEHKSQIGEPLAFTERMRARRADDSSAENPRYEERFLRIVFP
ncbi:MAG: PIG-L family deacetylase [Anaerolineales bacterium]|nr:PIG-L family deacetylase [Anaerolineales bacterium]